MMASADAALLHTIWLRHTANVTDRQSGWFKMSALEKDTCLNWLLLTERDCFAFLYCS